MAGKCIKAFTPPGRDELPLVWILWTGLAVRSHVGQKRAGPFCWLNRSTRSNSDPRPRGREVQFREGAVLQHSRTQTPLIEHEDDFDAPSEA